MNDRRRFDKRYGTPQDPKTKPPDPPPPPPREPATPEPPAEGMIFIGGPMDGQVRQVLRDQPVFMAYAFDRDDAPPSGPEVPVPLRPRNIRYERKRCDLFEDELPSTCGWMVRVFRRFEYFKAEDHHYLTDDDGRRIIRAFEDGLIEGCRWTLKVPAEMSVP